MSSIQLAIGICRQIPVTPYLTRTPSVQLSSRCTFSWFLMDATDSPDELPRYVLKMLHVPGVNL